MHSPLLRPSADGQRYELLSPTAMPRAAGFLWNRKMMIQVNCRGYAVAQFIRDGSDGSFRILDGALYTSLHRMEERGWVEAEWGVSENNRRAKYYRLTAAGRLRLGEEVASWNRLAEAMAMALRSRPQES